MFLKGILSNLRRSKNSKMQEENVIQSVKDLDLIVKSSRVLGRKKNRLMHKNEDHRIPDNTNRIYLLADGMGGHGNGDEASRITNQTTHNKLLRFKMGLREEIYNEDMILPRIKQAIEYTNNEVIVPLATFSNNLKKFGTTHDALMYWNNAVYIGHVGNSRNYLLRDNELYNLTEDHININGYRDLDSDELLIKTMSKDLTHYMGKNEIDVETVKTDVKENDMILMATDGLVHTVHESEIKDIMLNNEFSKIPSKLVYRANYPQKMAELYAKYNNTTLRKAKVHLGGNDNITLILMKFVGYKNG